ncbi:MFS transporter [Sphingopyxis sp. OPL5]|uniref:MFS transporter n=1 Tax=Sphingopyxis sp. OPL5 TaxID=2486273 RepID=UPI00164DC36A|nr:MFS transporter [Sphingopyxis sp. OPL5]QNO28544.1 MFS transporter [Sphingopyxis sp. OPL5]
MRYDASVDEEAGPRDDDAAVQGYPPASRAWASTALMTLLFAMAYLDRQIVSLMVEPISTEFGVGDFEISLLQGFAFALLFAVCGLPLGQAVDRYKRRYIILGGVMIWSIAAMSCGLAQNFEQLLFARMLVGAGEAALAPACYSLLADLFPRRKLTFAIAVFMLGALLGAELSLAIGGTILELAKDGVDLPLLGPTAGWRFAFIVTGLPGIFMAFLALFIYEPARPKIAQTQHRGWGEVYDFIRARKLFFFVQILGFSVVMALVYARLAWTPTFMMRSFGWSVSETSYALSTYGFIVGACCLLLGGRVVDHLFQKGLHDAHFRYYVVGGVVLALLGSAAYLSSSPSGYFLAMALPSFPLAMGAIGASAIQMVTPAPLRGRVSAVYLFAVSIIGMSAGPAIVGYMTDHWFGDPAAIGMSLALTFGACGTIVTIIFLCGLRAMRAAVGEAEAAGASASH